MDVTRDSLEVEIDLSRLRVGFRQMTKVCIGSGFIAITLAILVNRYVDLAQLSAWVASYLSFLLVRWHVNRALPLVDHDAKRLRRWKLMAMAGASASGGFWCVAIVAFLDAHEPYVLFSFSTILVFFLVGSLGSWISYPPGFVCAGLPPVLVFVIETVSSGTGLAIAAGGILLFFTPLAILVNRSLHASYDSALRVGIENEALRRKSESWSMMLGSALENMDQGLSMTGQDGRLRIWNQQFADLLGLSEDALRSDAPLEEILARDVPALTLPEHGRGESTLEKGTVVDMQVSSLPDGGRIATYSDVTFRVERERALAKATERAESANVAKTQFLAAASHDLRQPIHAISLLFALLAESTDAAEREELLSSIRTALSGLEGMLNDLLDISKFDAGVVTVVKREVPIRPVLERLRKDLAPLASSHANELRFRMPDVKVRTDPIMLERMLRNLIENALKYTERGRVLVGGRRRGDTLRIEIHDTGVGIPEDRLDDVFAEFVQLRNPGRDRSNGLGLGLSIVSRVANLLDHQIDMRSVLGRGTCFSVVVPCAGTVSEAGAVAAPASRVTPIGSAGSNVLVVDDDELVLRAMSKLMRRWGHSTMEARSISDLLARADAALRSVDLIITDHLLPGDECGLDVIDRVRRRVGKEIPAIVVTGNTDPELAQAVADKHAFLLHKPIQPEVLWTTIGQARQPISEDAALAGRSPVTVPA